MLINDFNGFSDADAIILLIELILLARTRNGKSNCLTNHKMGDSIRGSQLNEGVSTSTKNKMGIGYKLN